MSLDFVYTPLPVAWPGTKTVNRKTAKFKAAWDRTIAILEYEIGKLEGSDTEIAVNTKAEMIRRDGKFAANAQIYGPEAIVSFMTPNGRLQFATDTYLQWRDNVHAVAKTLESLRDIDRWGAVQGRQYSGFKALPSGTAATMSVQAAATIVSVASGETPGAITTSRETAQKALRVALAKAHPDRGGLLAAFQQLQQAKAALEAHHGGKL